MIARLVAVVAVIALGGCECGSAPAKKEATRAERERPERQAPTPTAPRPGIPEHRKPPPRELVEKARPSAAITLDEATAAMPSLGARELVAPMLGPGGTQARFTYCAEAGDLGAATTTVADAIRAAGWSNVTTRPPDEGAARSGIAAEKGDLRLAVTVQAVRRQGCDQLDGQFFTIASLSRITRAEPTTPAAP